MSDPDYQVCDDVALGEDGEFVVVWTEFPIEGEILGRRYDRLTAAARTGPFPVNADTTIDQAEASLLAKDAKGRFVAVWVQEDMATIRGRRFEADGTPLGGSFQVNTSTTHNNFRPPRCLGSFGQFRRRLDVHQRFGHPEAMARRFE